MASVVSICNNALIKMGEATILSLDDDTKRARICNEMYPELRDAVLRDHFWNFAVKREQLAPLAAKPSFGFDQQFQIPSDFIRLIRLSGPNYIDPDFKYQIEGSKILCNETVLNIIYVFRMEDPAMMDPLFLNALSTRIAMELSKSLADNDNLSARMRDEYARVLQEARTVDAQDDYAEAITATEWLQTRLY